MDSEGGIADDRGIPWHGKLPTDDTYYRRSIASAPILMGYGHYLELKTPYPHVENYVATHTITPLRPGFTAIPDARKFLQSFQDPIWNIGGAKLFASTIDLADELFLTRVQGTFQCTKFFPEFKTNFDRISSTKPITEHGITFHFEIWHRR